MIVSSSPMRRLGYSLSKYSARREIPRTPTKQVGHP